MGHQKPGTALFFSFIPGLGQVYCGRFLRGLAFLGGIFLCLLLFDFIFWDIGGFSLPDPFILLYLALLIWIGSAADAYLLVKDHGSELPEKETSFAAYLAYLVLTAVVMIIGIGLFFIILFIMSMTVMFSGHPVPSENLSISVEKNASFITLKNLDHAPPVYSWIGITVNGVVTEGDLNVTKGSVLVVNGTTNPDHLMIRACGVHGGCRTVLDTVV